MELIARLEERFSEMIIQIKKLKEENQLLQQELEQEKSNKQEARNRIESLLKRIQEEAA